MGKGRWVGVEVLAGAMLAACSGSSQPGPKTAPSPTPALMMDADPETPWSACLGRITPSGDLAESVEKIGRFCGSASGQRALSPVREGKQAEAAAADRFTFRADRPGSCFRVYAIGGEGVTDLGVEVEDPSGQVVATDEAAGPLAAAPHREPLCVEATGVYTIEVLVTRGGGKYALQVWTHQRTAEDEVPPRVTRPPGMDLPRGPDSNR